MVFDIKKFENPQHTQNFWASQAAHYRLWDTVSIWQRPLDSGSLSRACQWPDGKFPTEISIPAHLKALHERKYSSNVGLDKKKECPPTCMHLTAQCTHTNMLHADTSNCGSWLWLNANAAVSMWLKPKQWSCVWHNVNLREAHEYGRSLRPSLAINIRISMKYTSKT